MTDQSRDRPRPGITPKAQADHQARLEREAAALRENLRRRKAHIRARSAASPAADKETETNGKIP